MPTPRAPWAAHGTPWDEQRARSPEAISQRLHQGAQAFLQDMIRHARANVPGRENVAEEGLWPRFPQGSRAARTGVALPDRRPALLPGSGGRAATAGATSPAGGTITAGYGLMARCPHGPAQPSRDTGGACAPKGRWCIVAVGDGTSKAWARRADAGAAFFRRRHPPAPRAR
jgi:hypothetical protein